MYPLIFYHLILIVFEWTVPIVSQYDISNHIMPIIQVPPPAAPPPPPPMSYHHLHMHSPAVSTVSMTTMYHYHPAPTTRANNQYSSSYAKPGSTSPTNTYDTMPSNENGAHQSSECALVLQRTYVKKPRKSQMPGFFDMIKQPFGGR